MTAEIKWTLERIGEIWVKGELSNFKHHSSGHMYFTLKDDRAQVRAACFRSNNCYLKFRPEDGMEVLARGRLGVYEPRGDYQFIVAVHGAGRSGFAPARVRSAQGEAPHARDCSIRRARSRCRCCRAAWDRDLADRRGHPRHPADPRAPQRVARRPLYPARVQGTGAARRSPPVCATSTGRSDIDVLIVGAGRRIDRGPVGLQRGDRSRARCSLRSCL